MSWIKLHRCLLEWEWSDDPNMMALWVRLLLTANHEPKQWHGGVIERGQMFTSLDRLSEKTGLTKKQVRICLQRLQESNQIIVERAFKGQYITICKFNDYQDSETTEGHEEGTQTAQDGHNEGTKRATKQEYKEDKEEKEVQEGGKRAREQKPKIQSWCEVEWECLYYELLDDNYVWTKKEVSAVISVAGKLDRKMEEQGRAAPNQEARRLAFTSFVRQLWIVGDDWMRKNFSPHIIDDKFNEYYSIAKNGKPNGKQNTNNYGVSDEYMRQVAAELVG